MESMKEEVMGVGDANKDCRTGDITNAKAGPGPGATVPAAPLIATPQLSSI